MLHLFKSKFFLLGQGFVAAIIIVLFVARYLRWSMAMTLGAVMIVLVIGMIVLMVGFVRANKSASAIQDSMRDQADQQRNSVRPDNQAEIEQLQNDLEDAIERLKHTKLGNGRSGKSALYALPWYMIIGPPAAGKTTAIANSGLNFPIGMEAFRGVGGTRNCDWFFSDSAIFLDTAGRYMTEHEDTEEWNKFLEILKENRKKQPVNGVLIAISLSELADATPDQIEWHATTIRRRVDDLVTRLDVTFPIYLIFTKCDLIRGFTQFFGAMSRKERQQIFGCTLDRDWESKSDLRELFESEFDGIAGALLNWRNDGLRLSMKREERNLVYVFPLEFAAVKENVSRFVTLLFQPNPYRETPSFRGFYFTSGTQEGRPIDRVINAIAGRFGFEPTATEDAGPDTESKAYFIKDIFEDVIIPDRYLVSQTSRSAVRQRMAKSGIGAVTLIILVLFLIGATQAFFRSSSRIGSVREASVRLMTLQTAKSDLSDDDLATLVSSQALISELNTPPSFGWGLDRGDDLQVAARTVLLGKVREYVDVAIFPELKSRITSALGQADMDETRKDQLEEDTKAYLLLTSHTALLDSSNSAESLKSHLISIADELPDGGDPRVHELLGAFVDGVRDGIVDNFEPDSRLVETAVRSLRVPINPARLYNKLKRDNELLLGDFSLEELIQSRARYFSGNPRVSKFFTQNEWALSVAPSIEEYSAAPVRDAWVPWALDVPTVDPAEFERKLTSLYLDDYKNEWDRFLKAVRIKPFRDLRDAASGMAELGDLDDSPILWLLTRVSVETTFPASSGIGALAEDLAGDSREPQNVVEKHFRSLHALNLGTESGDTDPALNQALIKFQELSEDLEALAEDDEAAADFAADILQNRGGELDDARRDVLSALSTQSSSVRDHLFERPIILSWIALLSNVQRYLDAKWKNDVYDTYREQIAGRYPLADGEDIAIRDFQEFFRPNGDVSTFVREELSRFLRADGLQPRTWQRAGIKLSKEVQNSLQQIEKLQETLFSGDNLRWNFVLTADQPEPRGTRATFYDLDIHGITQRYDMGRLIDLSVSWPRDPGVTLIVSLADAELPPKQYDGEWAVFKFIHDAEITSISRTEYDLKWDVTRNIKAVYHAKVQSSQNPFSDRDLFNISLPATLGN